MNDAWQGLKIGDVTNLKIDTIPIKNARITNFGKNLTGKIESVTFIYGTGKKRAEYSIKIKDLAVDFLN